MEAVEIIILSIGVILVAVTYVLSEKFELGGKSIDEELSNNTKKLAEELAREEVERELADVIDEKVEAAAVELDKIANEKILAVGNYSDDILKKIDDNHNEVMFLYNMLNEKEAALKDTIRDIEALKLSIKKMALVNDMSVAVAKKVEQAAAKKRAIKEEQLKGQSAAKSAPNAGNVAKSAEAKEEIKTDINADINTDMAIPGKQPSEETVKKMVEMENDPNKRNRDISKETGNKNEEILKLHREGSTNMEIAKKLGIGIGEVRLVIDLFKR